MYLAEQARELSSKLVSGVLNSPDFGSLEFKEQAKIYILAGLVNAVLYVGDSLRGTKSISSGTTFQPKI